MNDNTTAFNISNAKNKFFGRRRLCPFWLLTAYIFYYSILGWRRFCRPAFFYLGQRLCNFHIIFRHCLSFVTSRLITTVFFGAVKSPTCSYNSPEILVWRRFRLPAFFYLGQRLRNCHIIFRHCIAEKLLLAESVLFFRSVALEQTTKLNEIGKSAVFDNICHHLLRRLYMNDLHTIHCFHNNRTTSL